MNLFEKSNVVMLSTFTLLLGGILFVERAAAASCDIVVSEPILDMGRVIHPGGGAGLAPHESYAVGTRIVSLNTSCSGETLQSLVVRGSVLGEQFRFAQGGQTFVSVSNAQLDGSSVDLAVVNAVTDVPSYSAASIKVKPGNRIVPVTAGAVARGTVLSVQVEIRPLVPLRELLGHEETSLESHIEFKVDSD